MFPEQKALLCWAQMCSEMDVDVENPGEVQMGFLTVGHQ